MIKSYKLRRTVANTCIYIILAVLGFIWISPFIYLVLHSFRDSDAIISDTLLPKAYTIQNYVDLFQNPGTLNFGRMFLNTLIVAIFSCIISTISVLMVSYAFSRLRFKSRKKFINIGMILGMFPGFMTMIAIYNLLDIMKLTETLVALVICYSAGAGLGFQISKGFFDTIPRALDEAATIDGAGHFQTFFLVVIPLAKAIIAVMALYYAVGQWNSYFNAMIFLQDETMYPLQLVLKEILIATESTVGGSGETILEQYRLANQLKYVSVIVSSLPVLMLYPFVQKYFKQGVMMGSLKE